MPIFFLQPPQMLLSLNSMLAVSSYLREQSELWQIATIANWVVRYEATQFAVTLTYHECTQLRWNEVRWDEWYNSSIQ